MTEQEWVRLEYLIKSLLSEYASYEGRAYDYAHKYRETPRWQGEQSVSPGDPHERLQTREQSGKQK